jgi:HEAT repeat protein
MEPLATVEETPPVDDRAAQQGPIIIPLNDFEREVVIVPKTAELKKLNWTLERFERTCWELVRRRDRETSSRFDPATVTFGKWHLGTRSDRPIRLDELAEVSTRALTFVPQDKLKDLAERLTSNPDTDSRLTISRLAGRAKNIVPMLLPHIRKSTTSANCHHACMVLKKIGPHAVEAIPVLVHKVSTADELDKSDFIRVLVAIGKAAVPELEKLLIDDSKYWTKCVAAKGLVKIGPDGLAAVHRAMKHKDALVRQAAAYSLGGSKDPSNISVLIAALDDTNAKVRSNAASSLGYHGPAVKKAVPRLLELLSDQDCRLSAIYALGNIHSDAQRVVPRLILFLEAKPGEDSDTLCCAALYALRHFNAGAKPAVLWQIVACLNREQTVVEAALIALAGVGGKDAAVAVKEVAACVGSKHRTVSEAALKALYAMGPDAAPAVKEVAACVGSKHSSVTEAALKALYAMGPDAAPAIKEVRRVLASVHRRLAARTLGGIGAPAREAFPDMLPLLVVDGSVPYRPLYCIRAMAAINIDGAIAAIRKDMKERKKVANHHCLHDMREAAILELEEIRKLAAEVRAATERAGGVSFTSSYRWRYLLDSSMAIRSGDGMERVIALIGPPFSASRGMLVYRGRSIHASKSDPYETLELIVLYGKVVEIRSGSTDSKK